MSDRYLQYNLNRKAEHRPFDLDSYLPQIAHETFKSTVVPIDPAGAEAMVSYYQQRYNGRHGALSDSHVERLKLLRKSVAHAIEHNFCGGPIFCRMTNRSPKDGEPRNIERLRQIYREELAELEERAREKRKTDPMVVWDNANLQMVAASAAQLQMLRCESADDVMNLLLSSERVFIDTLLALECRADHNDEWSTYLILREWNEDVRGDWEFRVFVHEGRVTAISQYNHYCIFPDLVAVDEIRLRREIVAFWEKVRDSIGRGLGATERSYVMDLVKLPGGTWKIIELNPFATTTGAGLFDWGSDSKILLARPKAQCDDPEVRIRREAYEGLGEYVQNVILPTISPLEKEEKPSYFGAWTDFLDVTGDSSCRPCNTTVRYFVHK